MFSPSVQVTESSHIHFIPTINSEIAAFCGHFERGPVNIPILVRNVDEFKFLFGRGIGEHYNDWYQVFNYLQYSSEIWVIRSCSTRTNANNSTDITIDSFSDYETQRNTITDNPQSLFRFIARTPGTWGNLLSIAVITKTEYDNNVILTNSVHAQDVFEFFENGYFGICVFRDGLMVESFYKVLQDVELLNTESKYVFVKRNLNPSPITSTNTVNLGSIGTVATIPQTNLIKTEAVFYDSSIIKLTNGSNSIPTDTDLIDSYDLFANSLDVDIDIIISNERFHNAAIKLAETRRDCICFVSLSTEFLVGLKRLLYGQTANSAYSGDVYGTTSLIVPKSKKTIFEHEVTKYIDTINQSEFVHFCLNAKIQFDPFSNKNKIMNVSGDTAGLKSKASLVSPWSVGAGIERGQIKNLLNDYIEIDKEESLFFYNKGMNIIEKGSILTQKTFITNRSVFDRVHQRSLANHIEKEIKLLLDETVLSENTVQKRHSIANQIKLYLKTIIDYRGIDTARVSVYPDDLNPSVVHVDVLFKHVSMVETVTLQLTNVGINNIDTIF